MSQQPLTEARSAVDLAKAVTPRVLLMVPCFNEARGVSQLLEEIRRLNADYDTLVVDDGSTDRTADAARPLSPVVSLAENLGIGGAVQTALKYAHERNYYLCVQVDGDGQHPPNQVERLIREYRDNPANVIVGSRYLWDQTFRSSMARRAGSRIIGWALRLLFGRRVTDPTSGFRLMDRQAIERFQQTYPLDFPEPISLAMAARMGLTVREVPVEMREREHGASSITGIRPAIYMVRVLAYLFLIWLQRPPAN